MHLRRSAPVFGDSSMQFLFEPFNLTARSTVIGQSMLEASARVAEIGHGTILGNRYSRIYRYGYSKWIASL